MGKYEGFLITQRVYYPAAKGDPAYPVIYSYSFPAKLWSKSL
jgi:hypothetical protein